MPTFAITGVSGSWGRRVAERLLATPTVRVLGIDRCPPDRPLAQVDFIKADIRNPLLAELFAAEQVDTLVHLAWSEPLDPGEADFESNVLGSMHLLGMAVDGGVRRVLWRSSTAVYGAAPQNPLYLPEDTPLASQSASPALQQMLEVERFIASLASDYPATAFAVLRLAHVIDADLDSPLTRLLRLPVWPDLLGFDPLLQLVDGEDAVAALVQAALGDWQGAVNVAADGVVTLNQLAGKLGRPTLPLLHLLVTHLWPLAQTMPQSQHVRRWFPLEPDQLRYACIAECQRMRSVLGEMPQHSASQAVERYVQQMRIRRYQPVADAAADDELLMQRLRAAASAPRQAL